MYRNSKSAFLQVTLNFELEYVNISSRHRNSNFAHSLDFYCLNQFCEKYQLVVDGLSLV